MLHFGGWQSPVGARVGQASLCFLPCLSTPEPNQYPTKTKPYGTYPIVIPARSGTNRPDPPSLIRSHPLL